jgi:uncharacterized protein YjiS (DUF1127 family)
MSASLAASTLSAATTPTSFRSPGFRSPGIRARLHAVIRSAAARLLRRLGASLGALHQPWREDLLSYDAHLLRDIGLTRAEAERLAGVRR